MRFRREVSKLAKVLRVAISLSTGFALIFSGAGWGKENETTEWIIERVPLPVLPKRPIKLRVAYLENPRFAPVSDAAIKVILAEANKIVQTHFGVTLQFEPAEKIELEAVFSRIPLIYKRAAAKSVFDFKSRPSDSAAIRRLAKANYAAISRSRSDLGDLIKFASPHLGGLIDRVYREDRSPDAWKFATVVTFLMLKRLSQIASVPVEDGRPAIDGSPFNEWAYWDQLGHGGLPWEVVITNQLVASAEYYGASLHTALRGGVTAGTTSVSPLSRYGSYSWISTFPFTGAASKLVVLRKGEVYIRGDEAERLAGALLAHEIGHQLFHFDHPFGNPACVMAPTPLMEFRRWHAAFDAEKCKVGSSLQMVPGAAKINFYRPQAY